MLHSTRRWMIGPCLALAVGAALPLAAGEWSRFRGDNGSGIFEVTDLPSEFSSEGGDGWRIEVPFGRSAPVLDEERVYVTAVESEELVTYAFARDSGKQLWRSAVPRARTAEVYSLTDSATPTPAVDGDGVYVFFQEFGLLAYDERGQERWRLPLGPFRNFYGMAASPIVAGEVVVLVCDQAGGSFVIGVERKSGSVRWRRERSRRLESYSTPILYPSAEKPQQVIVAGSRGVDAYELGTGKTVWSLDGIGAGPIASPVLAGDQLFVATISHTESGWMEYSEVLENDANEDGELSKVELEGVWLAKHFGWVDVDGDGSLSEKDWDALTAELSTDDWGATAIRIAPDGRSAKLEWNYQKNVPYIPTPLVYDGLLYLVKDGVVTSLQPETGELVRRDRLVQGSPKVYASPVAADGKIYFATLDGDIVVVAPGQDWKVVATSGLGEQIWTTPAVAKDGIFWRSKEHLSYFPVGATADDSTAESSVSGVE